MKRAFDIALCLLLAVPAFLVVVPLAVLVYLEDRHWPFYGGNRIGKGGRVYKLYKLRSMVVDAEKSGVDATPVNDPRITKVGLFLRRHKLDELPQLWNVFRGDMSIVGPRPNCQREYDMYSPEEKRILSILPGITDIASIVFSDEQNILKDTADPDLGYHQLVRPWKSRMCLIYADNISLRLDIELLVLTGVVLFSRSLALRGLQRIMHRLKAEERLTLVARRDVPLMPFPPLGMNTVVQTVPGKNMEAAAS
jgi:lipopolysaccharide/colanic/teichoic acid biosynthesis glycosyltransferase